MSAAATRKNSSDGSGATLRRRLAKKAPTPNE
jgi:hypothetical protein